MRLRFAALPLAAGLVIALLAGAGCEKSKKAGTDQAALPPAGAPPAGAPSASPMEDPHAGMQGMPPIGMTDAQGPTDGKPVPLKISGSNSVEELTRDLARLSTPAQRELFETAYRDCFSARKAQRDYLQALDLANKLIAEKPDFAPAYRVLGYARLNTGQMTESLNAYLKAVEIDPKYGEAHYALAFLYAMGEPAKGREHFQKAMKLGIKDEQQLGTQFYP
jgi:hypothetical protein